MTPDQWFEIIKISISSGSAIALAWIGVMTLRANRIQVQAAAKVSEAATKVEEVRTVLRDSTSNLDTKIEKVHHLVNGAMGSQLKITAMLAQRVADLSGHADDNKAALLAQEAWAEHEKNSVKPDAQGT